ncbi:hypothetical protein HMI56_007188 [Coelomomyces lativittatus]|nr:hypothetical protein HMI56_007188 [Coelomomyces lativittatus]
MSSPSSAPAAPPSALMQYAFNRKTTTNLIVPSTSTATATTTTATATTTTTTSSSSHPKSSPFSSSLVLNEYLICEEVGRASLGYPGSH